MRDLSNCKPVTIQTTKEKKVKYGRYIGDIWFQQGDQWTNASDLMVQTGHTQYVDH